MDQPELPTTYGPIRSDIDPLDIAWAAGVFDGEGCIRMTRGRPRLELGMTHAPTVWWFYQTFGGSWRVAESSSPTNRRSFRWQLDGAPAVEVCRLLLPYLRTKEAEADVIVQMPKVSVRVNNRWARLTKEEKEYREQTDQLLRILKRREYPADYPHYLAPESQE